MILTNRNVLEELDLPANDINSVITKILLESGVERYSIGYNYLIIAVVIMLNIPNHQNISLRYICCEIAMIYKISPASVEGCILRVLNKGLNKSRNNAIICNKGSVSSKNIMIIRSFANKVLENYDEDK